MSTAMIPSASGRLEGETHEPVGPRLDALRRERRPEHEAKKSLAPRDSSAPARVAAWSLEAIARGAKGLVEFERARREARGADVANEADVAAMVAFAVKTYRKLDVVFNNAGVAW